MSDCGVCISGDYGFDGSLDFYEAKTHKARKQHRCEECNGIISIGDQYEYISTKYDGEFSTVKTCLSSAEIRQVFVCGEFCFGDLWNDLREQVFPELTLSNQCLQKLSGANRTRLILEWQQWKGIR